MNNNPHLFGCVSSFLRETYAKRWVRTILYHSDKGLSFQKPLSTFQPLRNLSCYCSQEVWMTLPRDVFMLLCPLQVTSTGCDRQWPDMTYKHWDSMWLSGNLRHLLLKFPYTATHSLTPRTGMTGHFYTSTHVHPALPSSVLLDLLLGQSCLCGSRGGS